MSRPPLGGLVCSLPAGAARLPSVPPKRGPAVAESAPGSGCEAPASTKGSNPSPGARTSTEVRREAWRLRSGHRGLVYEIHRSLACCGLGRKPIPGENPDDSAAYLEIDHRAGSADLRGLLRCASPWACPTCAPKVAAARARVLAPQVAARIEAGWTAWLVTLTLRHQRGDDLKALFAGLGAAWSRLTSGKNGKALRRLGPPEFIRGLDLTWSARHGWHPHVHVVLLLPPGHGDGEATARALSARWRTVLGGLGWEALAGGQDVQACRNAEKAARYATCPAAVYESVGIATKTGSARAGATAFDLLRAAVPAEGELDPAAVARWCEYVAAVKGRRQTTVSRGLSLSEDAVLLEESVAPETDTLAGLGGESVAELDRTRRGPELLEAVEACAGDPEGAREVVRLFLRGLRARDWWIMSLPESEPPPLPDPGPGAPWVGPPPPVLPPGWCSPFTAEDRVWRKITAEDRVVLAELRPPV